MSVQCRLLPVKFREYECGILLSGVLQGGFYKVLFYKQTDMELFSTDDIVDDLWSGLSHRWFNVSILRQTVKQIPRDSRRSSKVKKPIGRESKHKWFASVDYCTSLSNISLHIYLSQWSIQSNLRLRPPLYIGHLPTATSLFGPSIQSIYIHPYFNLSKTATTLRALKLVPIEKR